MAFERNLANAAAWLEEVANPDGGWGLARSSPSSLVNTAEAVLVLRRARRLGAVKKGIRFLIDNLDAHLRDLGPRTRYAAFTLWAVAEYRNNESSAVRSYVRTIDTAVAWLLAARKHDGGWGAEADGPSALFPTFLAVRALHIAGARKDDLEISYQWILAASLEHGWGLRPGEGAIPVATAYASLALAPTRHASDDRLRAALATLVGTTQWGSVRESTGGTVWEHSTYAWVIPALIALGQSPYATTVANGIRHINTLRHAKGGWVETTGEPSRTVRAQFWVIVALGAAQDAYDPEKHSPRIDAERTQDVLREPDFIKFGVHGPWAMIVPARAYRLAVYALQAAAVVLLLDIPRRVPPPPSWANSLMSIGLLAVAYYLIKRRPTQFKRLAKIADWALIAITGLDLIFGWDLLSMMATVRGWLATLAGSA